MDERAGPGDANAKTDDTHMAVAATVAPPPDATSVVEESAESTRADDDKLASTSASNPSTGPSPLVAAEPPRLAVVTDIQIPQNFNFPTSPPPASSSVVKSRYNAAVLDEFDPLVSAKPASPKLQTARSSTQQTEQPRPATPTSASATLATFPSIASTAWSFISRPSSPASATRPGLPSHHSPKRSASALPTTPQSPATRTKPIHASTLSTSSTAPAGPVNPPPDPEQFDFPRFLDQLKSRPADPVAKYLRSFLHNFSKKTFTVNDQIKLVHDFLVFISARMRECDIWKRNSEVEFDNAVEGMEKLVMNRLYEFTFSPQISRSGKPVTTDDLERDRVLKQRIALFGWIRPEHLDIPMKLPEGDSSSSEKKVEDLSPASAEKSADSEISMGFLLFAQQEMNKIDHYKAPRDKLICILNSCKVIFGLIRHLQGDGGADSFIPLLIFVLIRANPEHLLSNIEYINRFRRASKLQSEAGYYLSSLMGAVSFVETMDHTSLSNITQQEFETNVEQAILALPPSPDPSSPAVAAPIVSSRSTGSDLSQLAPASSSSSAGEESARTLQLPQVAAIAEDTRKFLERTGESISKPLTAIGRIFGEILDDEPQSPSRGYPGASGQVPYRIRSSQPGTPREQPGLLPPLQFPNLGLSSSFPNTPSGVTPPRPGSPLDFSVMQAEIDRAHAAAADAARNTLQQIFPTMDREVTDMILEANNGDLGLSIDKLLEMSLTEN
ncbi:hypothetical protein FRC12_010847 [Ceratobasidium sp. 428]|nr:hypothetical protein FRC12_010847 [Ceratobasidium sp. 428]